MAAGILDRHGSVAVRTTRDRAVLRAFLERDRLFAAYSLCDLVVREFGRTRWGSATAGDEVLAVGDEAFARRCLDSIAEIRARGKTIFFVSHSLVLVEELCDRVLYLDKGRVKGLGDPREMLAANRRVFPPVVGLSFLLGIFLGVALPRFRRKKPGEKPQ